MLLYTHLGEKLFCECDGCRRRAVSHVSHGRDDIYVCRHHEDFIKKHLDGVKVTLLP